MALLSHVSLGSFRCVVLGSARNAASEVPNVETESSHERFVLKPPQSLASSPSSKCGGFSLPGQSHHHK